MAARPELNNENRKIAYKARKPYANKGVKIGRKPGSWKIGPDDRRHDQYIAWLRHKSQAAFRSEPHEITFTEWESIWNTDWAWENRGRETLSINLRRKDREKGWTMDNIEMISRRRLLQETASEHRGMTYNKRSK